MFKKRLESAKPVIIAHGAEIGVGFQYVLGEETYKVIEVIDDVPNRFYIVLNSRGEQETLTSESLQKDFKDPKFKIINEP